MCCPHVGAAEEPDDSGDDEYDSDGTENSAIVEEVDVEASVLAGDDDGIPRSRSGSLTLPRDRTRSSASASGEGRRGSRTRSRTRTRTRTRTRGRTKSRVRGATVC